MKPQPILIALLLGAALALPALLMPAARLEPLVVVSGLPTLIPAARPPLGESARTLLAVTLGLAPLLVALLAIAIARHRKAAAEARSLAELEAAEAGRRLFRPAPLPRKEEAEASPSAAPAADTGPEPSPAPPEPATLDLSGAIIAAPEELGSPPPEPVPQPRPAPLVEPESLRKPRPGPAAAPPPAPEPPPAGGNRTRLEQLEAMLGTLPPLPHQAGAAPPSEGKRKARAKGAAATARDLKSGVVRAEDGPADRDEIAARLERALAELRRLER